MPGISVETITYAGWPQCVRISDGRVELIATTDVGPRVISLRFLGGENLFAEFKGDLGQTGGEKWRLYGGHRLWHAPEHPERTYWPDNQPVEFVAGEHGVTLLQPVETTTGLQKEMAIEIIAGEDRVRVTHRLRNLGGEPVRLAPWALSVMAPGGRVIVPQEPVAGHPEALLPARPLVLWPYTNMADERFTWGEKFIVMRHRHGAPPTKFGARNTRGWAVYTRGEEVFLKRARFERDAEYPDFGSNFEFFTNDKMLEVETLAPLRPIEPGTVVEHVEEWFLFRREVPEEEEHFASVVEELAAKAAQ